MNKFELSTRRSLAIVSYIAASMGYSKEEIKFITAGMLKKKDEVNEFHKILTEPLDKIVRVEHKGEVNDLVEPFNLVERIQMVIELILNKSTVTEPVNLKPTASIYQYSPFKFSNFTKKPVDESKLAHEEYLCDEALIKKFGEKRLEAIIKERVEKELQKREQLDEERLEMLKIDEALRKAKDATLRGLKGKEVEIPNFKPAPDVASSEEIDEVNQAIEGLIRVRNKLITNLNEQNEEQPKFNLDNIQKAQEQPEPYEPVKFTEEQRQRQREILGNPFASTSRYDQIANEKVRKSSEYFIRDSSEHLFDKTLRNRTETEAMLSRSIEIYPSTNLCKDSLDVNNLKELFSFVRVDGDRLYRINDSSVQPWNRNKPLGSVRLVKGDFDLFNAIKFIVKVDEDAIKEYVDKYFDNPLVVLEAFNNKYGSSITLDDIVVGSSFETPNQYLFRCSYYRAADELKESLKKDRIKLIKGLVRASVIVAMADKELHDWVKGKNPTNS
jgi:hypothetical protein|nr:MAG TPA: hypothetical protein [Caudoviricetes sp.]